ncbi:MAG: 30S ribosomal protein S6, partial [Bacteroidota bacterium]
EAQMKDTVEKFKKVLLDNKADIVNEENWGLRKLAYNIQHKTTGFYQLFEFEAEPTVVAALETEYRRDEAVLRFLTTALDKHAIVYNERRKKGAFRKDKKEEAAAS